MISEDLSRFLNNSCFLLDAGVEVKPWDLHKR